MDRNVGWVCCIFYCLSMAIIDIHKIFANKLILVCQKTNSDISRNRLHYGACRVAQAGLVDSEASMPVVYKYVCVCMYSYAGDSFMATSETTPV